MPGLIKICGVNTTEAAIAAADARADFIGFVFFKKSPRYIAPEAAEEIVTEVKWACEEGGFASPRFVGLFVDAGERLMAEAAPFLSHFQLHGHEEPERVTEIGAEFGVEVIKALGVSGKEDIIESGAIADAADMLLFDARAPAGADRPGGHGATFEWALLAHYRSETPFLLAGGLDETNVSSAVAAARANTAFAGVDASSALESAPGVKDPDRIKAFVKAARDALG